MAIFKIYLEVNAMTKHIFSAFFILFLVAAIGWGLNIYKLVTECDFRAPYKCEIVRSIGTIPPIGGIVGWISLGK